MNLTRYLHLEDYEDPDLQKSLRLVDQVGIGSQASEHRRWEYALALLALQRWGPGDRLLDVGGAGSPFCQIARLLDWDGLIVDPRENLPLAAWRQLPWGQQQAAAVTCLSVLEHIPDEEYEAFLTDLCACVQPGGLLILTMDAAVTEGPDIYRWHWMRERIYTPLDWWTLRYWILSQGFTVFGGVDPRLPPPCVSDYTFASIVLRKDS